MAHLLVARFSALGDVAMTVPVIASLAAQHPELKITVLSRRQFAPLFECLPGNVAFVGVDLKKEYRGILGIKRLASDLELRRFSAFADFHDVLRTKFLRLLCRFSGIPVAHIDKGRAERAALTRAKNKHRGPLTTVFEKYTDVLARLGYPISLDFRSIYSSPQPVPPLPGIPATCGAEHWVGVAPFAAHAGKVYPLEQTRAVVAALAARSGVRVFLFGAGPKERAVLEEWEGSLPRVHSVAGRLPSMKAELQLMSRLSVMLSMDSANMHLASLVGVPVVSVWGATHPDAGFLGWRQSLEGVVQIPDLPCRPCSIYGQKPCLRGDYACLARISSESVVEALIRVGHLDEF